MLYQCAWVWEEGSGGAGCAVRARKEGGEGIRFFRASFHPVASRFLTVGPAQRLPPPG